MNDLAKILKKKHPEYEALAPEWERAHDFFSGDCLRDAKKGQYVIKRDTAESDAAYAYRLKISDYRSDMARLINSVIGAVFANEDDANYVTQDDSGKGIGDRNEKGTLAYRLERNCDGNGTGRVAFLKKVLEHGLTYHRATVMIDAVVTEDERSVPTWKLLPVLSLTNWVEGRSYLIKEEVDTRDSIFDEASSSKQEQYLHIGPASYERYVVDKDGNASQIIKLDKDGNPVDTKLSFVDRFKRPVPPIKTFHFPMIEKFGLNIALQSQGLMNRESIVDSQLINSAAQYLALPAEDELFKKQAAHIKKGTKIIQVKPPISGSGSMMPEFIGPTAEGATVAVERIKQLREELHTNAYQSFADQSTQKTATAIEQESASGFGSFLVLCKAFVDEVENWLLDMTAQAEWPGGILKENWFIAHIKRSEESLPIDAHEIAKRMYDVYFGENAAPLGREVQVQAAKEIARLMGFRPKDEEIEAWVDFLILQKQIDVYAKSALAVPRDLEVKLAQCSASMLNMKLSPDALRDIEEAREMKATEAQASGFANSQDPNQDPNEDQEDPEDTLDPNANA